MGLFHDTCTAIIDASTNEALTGEALAAAKALLVGTDAKGRPVRLSGADAERVLASRGWGICGNRVGKKARFCNKCGSGAPKGWVKCPACGRWVGNDSCFCPHCNHPLHPEERVDVAGGVWDRDPGVFAQRFECGDAARQIGKEGLQVQEGTVAILLDGGRKAHVLGPGRHTPDGTLRAINWFGNPPPRSVVLVSSGDMVFHLDFPGLRSAEELPVSASAEVTLRFVPELADAFLANFLKELRSVAADSVCGWLMAEAASAVKDLALQSRIEDLVKDPDRRPRFEDAISRALADLLARNGIELVRVGAVEFDGPDYERMRGKYADLDKARRELEFKKANLALIAAEDEADKADAKATADRNATAARENAEREASETEFHAKKEKEVSEYLAQLAQEKDLSGIERSTEAQLALRAASGTLARKDAELEAASRLERDAREMETLAHKLDLDLKLRDYTRDSLLKDAEAAARVAAVKRSERLAEARTAAEVNTTTAEAWARQAGAVGRGYADYAKSVLEVQRLQQEIQREHLKGLVDIKAQNAAIKSQADRERAAAIKGLTATEIAAMFEGNSQAQAAFLAQARAETLAKLTKEQILAMEAGQSQAAAAAYAAGEQAAAWAKAGADAAVAAELRNQKNELRQDTAAARAQDASVFATAAAVANEAAKRPVVLPPPPSNNQQIIK